MTVKNRIAKIRLSEKINKNKEYAESIGVYAVNRRIDDRKKNLNAKTNGEYYKLKDGEEYEYKRRTTDFGNEK